MEKIKLNNTTVQTRKVFKRFDGVDVNTEHFWQTDRGLLGISTNNHRYSWADADVRIDSYILSNGSEVYKLFIDDEYIEGELSELSVETVENRTVVHCSLIIGWD